MPACLPVCGFVSGNRARPLRRAPCPSFDPLAVYIYGFGVDSPYTYTASGSSPVQSASPKRVPPGVGPKQSRAVHLRELGKRRMRSFLPSGKSVTPPARCIHRPQRDTSSAGYRLLVSRASCGASRELSSRRSPALAPHTCAVSPTFRYGAFLFVAFALADASSARLTTPGGKR